jgi:hypothetical protein
MASYRFGDMEKRPLFHRNNPMIPITAMYNAISKSGVSAKPELIVSTAVSMIPQPFEPRFLG